MFVVIGNHENRPLYEKWIGPPELAFDLPGLASRVIIGDNAGYRLGASQLEWLRRQLLDSPKHTFVSYHIPPQTGRWRRHSFAEGSGEMIRLLAASRVSRAFFGHIHVFDEDTVTGVHYVVTGGAGAPLYAWAPGVAAHHIVVVKVEKGTVTHRMVPVEQ